MARISIERFIETYGQALTAGVLEEIADCWVTPALVMTETGAIAVMGKDDVMGFFEQVIASHGDSGQTSTVGEIINHAYLTTNVVAVDVRWPTFDVGGVTRKVEMAHYLLRVGDDGKARIQVALNRTVA